MSAKIRTVRLDAEAERALKEVRRSTGLSISEVLKKGIFAVQHGAGPELKRRPYEIYAGLELGRGGHARAPARNAKQAIRSLIAKKRSR